MSDAYIPARITMREGPTPGRSYEITAEKLVIGRQPPADLVIDSQEVSRAHARLQQRLGRCFLQDLNSRNGTFINGKRCKGTQELADGDEIALSPGVILVFSQAQGEHPPAAADAPPSARPSQQAKTMLDLGAAAPVSSTHPSIPPVLAVTLSGQETLSFPLVNELITLGRSDENDIVIPSLILSRHHANLRLSAGGYEIEVLPGVTNTLTCQGRPVTTPRRLAHGDVLRIDSDIPGMMVSMTYQAPLQAASSVPFSVTFGEKERLTIGRDAGNDVVLDNPGVSRYHAQVTRVGRRYYVTDLHSTNGTFVNDKRVTGDVWLNPADTIRISQYRLVMGEDQFTRFDETQGLRLESVHLNKWVRKDLNLLQDISLSFQPREFIVIVGQSGGGKSTLLDAISGYRPATHGNVFVNGIDIYNNFDAIRNEIGYVPQRDIIHMELTVYQALDFAAQLRMPRDTTPAERHKRILQVLADLDLTHRQDMQVSSLSGGQQKRVSIGVELLTSPGLFFLDEPTSGLDPGTETAFMHLMRRLADQGRTIILVTHATKNVMLADKVVFLARGGHLAWYGPPDAALAYFDQYRSEVDRRTRPMEFDQIYAILDDPHKGKGSEWAERFRAHPAYTEYIITPLQEGEKSQQKPASQVKRAARPARRAKNRAALRTFWHQFLVLSRRNITILRRDRSSMTLMLAAAPGVGALALILAPVMGRAPFDFTVGEAASGGITLFLLSLYALLVGGMSQMREFVKETDIYKRERLVNLQILPYITSKMWVAFLLAFWHALAYTLLHYLAFRMPGGFVEFLQVYVTLTLAVMTGMMLGLLASAVSPNAASAPLTLIMMLIPLIVLSGALAPIPPAVSQVASSRWAFQSLLGITGVGSDVAADPCWYLDEELRDGMTLDDKAAAGCQCMGVQMFAPQSCSFPGTGSFYVPEIDEAAPVEPAGLPDPPPEPAIPDAPDPPEDKYNEVKMAQYLNALTAYQDQVRLIQEDYRNEMSLYQVQADVYTGQMTQYIENLARYNIARVSAVRGAEETIATVTDKYGWAWVDKSDPKIYIPWLLKTWLAQVVIIAVYFVVIVLLIRRKDAK